MIAFLDRSQLRAAVEQAISMIELSPLETADSPIFASALPVPVSSDLPRIVEEFGNRPGPSAGVSL